MTLKNAVFIEKDGFERLIQGADISAITIGEFVPKLNDNGTFASKQTAFICYGGKWLNVKFDYDINKEMFERVFLKWYNEKNINN